MDVHGWPSTEETASATTTIRESEQQCSRWRVLQRAECSRACSSPGFEAVSASPASLSPPEHDLPRPPTLSAPSPFPSTGSADPAQPFVMAPAAGFVLTLEQGLQLTGSDTGHWSNITSPYPPSTSDSTHLSLRFITPIHCLAISDNINTISDAKPVRLPLTTSGRQSIGHPSTGFLQAPSPQSYITNGHTPHSDDEMPSLDFDCRSMHCMQPAGSIPALTLVPQSGATTASPES
ncbi:hypothetical protein CPLU01_06514 [Colletotrichum plurivorum]|uniref:Uncharacterized protein n=1 Tax=Colletotrichum plurivorum TaxID=2175906 RepID=A0A8H6KIA8_9PEZI|nr:hypothetical protein CPLU01_06514 [Colletotrichum plurivorum]